jgi:hypothetical protein
VKHSSNTYMFSLCTAGSAIASRAPGLDEIVLDSKSPSLGNRLRSRDKILGSLNGHAFSVGLTYKPWPPPIYRHLPAKKTDDTRETIREERGHALKPRC